MVVLAGSVVRTTGSGMGCPDWPKCFGQWVPPTSVEQIPENYKEIYSTKREKKLLDFCRYLDVLGFQETADKMRNDPALLEEQDFNAGKTWTEYVNRLVGFVAGNLMLIQFIITLIYFRRRIKIVLLSLLNLMLISFTAWLGAIVVATNLLPWMITVHMALALLIVVLQVLIIMEMKNGEKAVVKPSFKNLLVFLLLLSSVQILMGTQVRQQIDVIGESFGGVNRDLWVQHLSLVFYVHRSFSLLILAIAVYLIYRNSKLQTNIKALNFILLIVAAELVSGVVLSYFSMPAFIQPVHLLLSTLMLMFEMVAIQSVSIRKT